MDPEIALVQIGQKEDSDSKNFFDTSLEQKVGLIGSAIVFVLGFMGIIYFVLKTRRKNADRRYGRERLAPGRMLERNIEFVTKFPYSRQSENFVFLLRKS